MALLGTVGGAALWLNEAGNIGKPIMAVGVALLILFMMFGWFGTVIRESLKGYYNKQCGHLVPHGNDVVHLLRGDVLRGVLRRALLRAGAVGAVARRRRPTVR